MGFMQGQMIRAAAYLKLEDCSQLSACDFQKLFSDVSKNFISNETSIHKKYRQHIYELKIDHNFSTFVLTFTASIYTY